MDKFSNPTVKFLSFVVVSLGVIFTLLPLVIIVYTSFFANSNSGGFTVEYYQQAWEKGKFLLAFANSSLVAIVVTLLQVITSTLAGYSLSRLSFKGKNIVLLLVITTLVIPFQLLVIPIFLILKSGGMINTYWALILPTSASGFGIFLMRQYFMTIPIELEEAATLDGASQLQIIWHILLPLIKPAIVTLALFAFIGEWNDLFKPLVFTNNPKLVTVQLALASFQEQFTSDWSLLMAGVVIASLPIIILFFIGQKQLIQGIGTTGIKS